MSADASSLQELSLEPHSAGYLITFVKELLAAPNSRVSIEHSQGRSRLRYMVVNSENGRTVRKALELPTGDNLSETLKTLIHQSRIERKTRHEEESGAAIARGYAKARRELRKRLLAACPYGRIIRRRLGLVFDIAADLGSPTLTDFFERKPWYAKLHSAGRRRKQR